MILLETPYYPYWQYDIAYNPILANWRQGGLWVVGCGGSGFYRTLHIVMSTKDLLELGWGFQSWIVLASQFSGLNFSRFNTSCVYLGIMWLQLWWYEGNLVIWWMWMLWVSDWVVCMVYMWYTFRWLSGMWSVSTVAPSGSSFRQEDPTCNILY